MIEKLHTEKDPEQWTSVCADQCLPAFFDGLEEQLDSPLLQRAMGLLRENPTSYVSVEEWAIDIGVSREHLTRSMTPTMNPHALLQATRVCLALTQLARQEKLKAAEALEAMGYSSRAHGFAVFKKVTGTTPTQFWNLMHDPKVHHRCVLDRCPLVGAMLDRYKRRRSLTA
jgi:AraC-like DNA-binding protein